MADIVTIQTIMKGQKIDLKKMQVKELSVNINIAKRCSQTSMYVKAYFDSSEK